MHVLSFGLDPGGRSHLQSCSIGEFVSVFTYTPKFKLAPYWILTIGQMNGLHKQSSTTMIIIQDTHTFCSI